MIVRKLNFLMPKHGYKKVEVSIYGEKNICTIYIENKGYAIYINGNEEDMFLIKTNMSPDEFKSRKNAEDNEDFINLIKLLLDQIYADIDIPEYEEQHHEFVFLKIMDYFSKNDFKVINEGSDLYKTIEWGFMKLDIDLLNLKVNNETNN
ncbi:hypothetical protein [Methanobrevibacter millerae]|uniref:Uncharacterized protein n=1 Tax=Methanobrevibacter millerae TaxID=230361 RepID=A0A1G5UTY5_9EURY|nr:hypothetical protein [Methanobrevibacter millerae]SDA37039.1 hypothetical protein SAMN02910315_00023 [Methanobrevibacter millerae]